MKQLLVSGESFSKIDKKLGSSNYSYAFARQKMLRSIAINFKITFIQDPCFFNSNQSFSIVPDNTEIHVAFSSSSEFRLVKGMKNVIAFAWEFDVISDEDLYALNPFDNMKRMLTLADQIWATSNYTKTILEKCGLDNVVLIPAPIEAPKLNRESEKNITQLSKIVVSELKLNTWFDYRTYKLPISLNSTFFAENDKILNAIEKNSLYLTILNPHDKRKNLINLIAGFEAFSKENSNAVLMIKFVISSSSFNHEDFVIDNILPVYPDYFSVKSKSILFFFDYLDETQMSALYNVSTFYLCASISEGQNLPLLESMIHGCIPVTTAGTAMKDYINGDNSVLINVRRRKSLIRGLAGNMTSHEHFIEQARASDIFFCASTFH